MVLTTHPCVSRCLRVKQNFVEYFVRNDGLHLATYLGTCKIRSLKAHYSFVVQRIAACLNVPVYGGNMIDKSTQTPFSDFHFQQTTVDKKILELFTTMTSHVNLQYWYIKKHRQNKRGGGVGVFVKNNQRLKERADLSIFYDNIESVFIEIDKSCRGFSKCYHWCYISPT